MIWPVYPSFFTITLMSVCEDMSIPKVVDGKITRKNISTRCVSPKRTISTGNKQLSLLHR